MPRRPGRKRGGRARDRRAAAGHRGGRARRAAADEAVSATGRCWPPGRCCWARRPWRCWLAARWSIIVAVSVVRGFGFGLCAVVDRRAYRRAAAARTARRRTRPVRGRGRRAGSRGSAVGCLARWPLRLPGGRRPGGRGRARSAGGVPVAARRGWPRAGGSGRRRRAPAGLLAGLRHDGQLRLSLIFAASTVAGGVVVSFLPLAAGVSGSRRRHRPARPGPDRHDQPLVGGMARRPARPRAPAGAGAGHRVPSAWPP